MFSLKTNSNKIERLKSLSVRKLAQNILNLFGQVLLRASIGNVHLGLSREFGGIGTTRGHYEIFMRVTLQHPQAYHAFAFNTLQRHLKFSQNLSMKMADENRNIIQVIISRNNLLNSCSRQRMLVGKELSVKDEINSC